MIFIKDLKFSYAESGFGLDIGQLEISRAETVAFIGPSGSGKTTLLNLISGITLPRAGNIRTHETEVSRLPEAGRRAFRIKNIGMVFQDFELLEHLNVLDNILLPYRIHPALRMSPEVREHAQKAAGEVGLADMISRPVGRLSQGEKQRVAICRSLLPEPALLLADEPTGNLDPANKGKILDILFAYAEGRKATLVTVTHDHNLLDRFDRVIDFSRFHATARTDSQPGGGS